MTNRLYNNRSTPDGVGCCRVCRGDTATALVTSDQRRYWHCARCASIFLDAAQLPDRQTEYDRYTLHNNDPDDPRYQKFLSQLGKPLLKKLTPGMKGLDFGCGAGPALGLMLAERGFAMTFYDPFFFQSDASVLNDTYDFIILSEVVEHFHQPAQEFSRLDAMLNPGGWLGIMTCLLPDDGAFEKWYYRRDPTHVVFYCEQTFNWLSERFGWRYQIAADNVVLIQKTLDAKPPYRWH